MWGHRRNAIEIVSSAHKLDGQPLEPLSPTLPSTFLGGGGGEVLHPYHVVPLVSSCMCLHRTCLLVKVRGEGGLSSR